MSIFSVKPPAQTQSHPVETQSPPIENFLATILFSTLSIQCSKGDKLRQTNCNEFLDNFVMKAGQYLFDCLLCYIQPYLIR